MPALWNIQPATRSASRISTWGTFALLKRCTLIFRGADEPAACATNTKPNIQPLLLISRLPAAHCNRCPTDKAGTSWENSQPYPKNVVGW